MPAVQPLICIKAGKCNQDASTVMPLEEPGLLYIYLHPEEELHHLCWQPRSASGPSPEDDLLIIPGDARFHKYPAASTGRIFVLKFSSSSQRRFYWLQSQSEREGEPGYWSERDEEWGRRIDKILRGDEGEEDEEMGDAPVQSGDIEQEGDQSRRGGEDGGRATTTTSTSNTNPSIPDIASLISSITVPTGAGAGAGAGRLQQRAPTVSLNNLLSSQHTLPALQNAPAEAVESLISNLPPALVPAGASLDKKKEVIARVLQSPQFQQGCVSLTIALREGALRGVADSLRVPLAPGEEGAREDQVEVFLRAVKREME